MTSPGSALFASRLRAERRPMLAAAALSTAAAGLELVPFWTISRMGAEALAPRPDGTAMVLLAGLVLGAALARLLLFGAANVISHRVAFRLQRDLRLGLVRALHAQPLGQVDGRTGDLKKTLVDDVGRLEHLVAHTLPDAVAGLAVPVLALPILLWVDWRMTLAALALLPVAVLAQRAAFGGLAEIHAQWHAADVRANAGLLGYLRGMATLKAFDRVASSFATLRESVHALAGLTDRITRHTAIPYALFFVTLSTSLVVVLPVGLALHLSGSLALADLLLFVSLGAGLTAPLLRVAHAMAAWQRQMQGADRIAAVLNAPPLPIDGDGRPCGTDIALAGVRFGYRDGADVLRDVTLDIPAGSVTALVGPSGAGKSTLARLIARDWDVRAGAIRIGGTDIRALPPERLHALLAVVFQDPFFFDGTIRENLAIAAPEADEPAMGRMLAAAGLAPLIARLPHGLDTPIGERAARLSRGERQRLAIARALLKDAPILLLDEATASADPESEREVQQGIARLSQGRTVVVIAHRLRTVMHADRIAVLADGRLEAIGRHGDLLRNSDVYRRLWVAQERAVALADGDAD